MPDNAFFFRSLGRILEEEGRLEEALSEYKTAQKGTPIRISMSIWWINSPPIGKLI
ncbi:MAG: hypothetical protein CM1200mP40_09060 [Gammaproteobacteria bacterium]|nr:MAG: hypothetical protein CM1200mP40_09060 [Gammaproteobacteria bacterium]